MLKQWKYFEASLATNSKATDNDKNHLQENPRQQSTVRFITRNTGNRILPFHCPWRTETHFGPTSYW